MKRPLLLVTLAVFALSVPALARTQTTPPPTPAQAFRTLHLVNIIPGKEAQFLASLEAANQLLAKLGCKECRYRVWKVYGQQAGTHEYVFESAWPSGAVYDKIHYSPEWKGLWAKATPLDSMVKDEVYNRLVEVPTKK